MISFRQAVLMTDGMNCATNLLRNSHKRQLALGVVHAPRGHEVQLPPIPPRHGNLRPTRLLSHITHPRGAPHTPRIGRGAILRNLYGLCSPYRSAGSDASHLCTHASHARPHYRTWLLSKPHARAVAGLCVVRCLPADQSESKSTDMVSIDHTNFSERPPLARTT